MTRKIDETQLIKDFHKGMLYIDMAIKHNCHVATIAYRLRKLGLRRNKQSQELFSVEEKDIVRSLIDTHRGREQLLDILRGK